MERLTDKKEADAQRQEYENRLEKGYPRNIPEERFLKLAAYEDTGLEPEEIYRERFLIAARKDPEKLARLRALFEADADVAPVVHGRWVKDIPMGFKCNLCKCLVVGETNFCPKCGAKMDLPRRR